MLPGHGRVCQCDGLIRDERRCEFMRYRFDRCEDGAPEFEGAGEGIGNSKSARLGRMGVGSDGEDENGRGGDNTTAKSHTSV